MNTRISNDKEPSCLPWRVGYTKLKADPCPPHCAVSLYSRLKQRSSKLRRFAFRSSPASSHQRAESQSMSQSRPPYDPAQLPRQQSNHPRAGEMAQTQRPPSFPSAGFLGQSNQRPVPGPQLPPLLGLQGQQRAMGGSARPAGLSPMEPSPSVNDAAGQQGGRVIPVSQLLSNSPPSPRRAAYNATQHEQAPTGAYRTPPQMMQISPNAMYQQRPVHQPAPQPHRLDHPPQYMNQMQPQYQVQPGPPRQPMPQQYVSPTGAPKNGPQYSPAPTNYSTPSCYDSQSEVSPTSTAAPPMPFSRVSQTPPLNYNLTIRQQPAAARACGFGERDRRVIDPPPILELKITDKATGAPEQDHQGMLALHCTLLNPSNQDDETQAPAIGTDMQSTRRLMGTLVASPYPAKDENQVAGTFFVFPDLSCRAPGRYRLHFKLLRIDPLNMQQGAVHGTVASCITDVFSVYTAKDFPGMRASSALLKALRRQGLNVGVKKGSEARRGNRRAKKEDASSSEDEDSDGSGDERGGGAGGRMMIDSMPAQGGDLSAKMNRVSKKHKRRRDS